MSLQVYSVTSAAGLPRGPKGCSHDHAFGRGLLAGQKNFLGAYPAQSSIANLRQWSWFQADHQQCDRGEPSLVAGVPRDVA